MAKRKSLLIPVHKSDELVEMFTDELPEDPNDIMEILRAEIAPLEVWLNVAVEYYLQGKVSAFEQIFEQATMADADEIYNDDAARKSRLKILNAWASHHINTMWKEDDERRREVPSQKAAALFQKADRIDPQCATTLIGKALMFMAKGEDERAERFLKTVLQVQNENLPAILATALLHLRKKKYVEAKKLYQEAITLHPHSPQAARMRMAFAYCCYQMGCVDKARAVMKYASKLDDGYVDAMMANAIWQLASLSPSERARNMQNEGSRFMAMVHHAHALDKSHPSVLNHLANHYFLQWTPLAGTVAVERGSSTIVTSHDLSSDLESGQLICINNKFYCYVVSVSSDNTITIDVPYNHRSRNGLSISRKMYDQMFALAANAYHNTQSKELRAESCFLMGRCRHAEGKYQEAYGYYYKAGQYLPTLVSPWVGLAQMCFHQNSLDKTTAYLEKTLKQFPDNTEVLLFLAHVYSKTNRKPDAIAYYRKVADADPGNVEALIGVAEILHVSDDRTDQLAAISSFLAAEKVLNTSKEPVPMELHVNLGSLHMRVGAYDDAIKCYLHALSWKATLPPTFPEPTENNITVLYNTALVYERLGDINTSVMIYESILKAFPCYTDAALRLACIKRDQGLIDDATSLLEATLARDTSCANAALLQGNIHFCRREWSLAQKKFELVLGMKLENGGNLKNDPYSFLSMGNIFMSNIGERGRYMKNMSLSETYYKKTLQNHPNNIYAANGIGIMMAEKGHLDKAKMVFAEVRQAYPDMPDAWINLAHIYMAEERHDEAIQLYQVSLVKHYQGHDIQIILYLAKAYYEAKRHLECIATLTRGLHIQPSDLRLWYNLGLAQEEFAVFALGDSDSSSTKLQSHRTLADVQRAISDLQRAQRIFQMLTEESTVVAIVNGVKKEKTLPFDLEKVREHAKFCAETLDKASYHLEFERQREEKRKAETEHRRRLHLKAEEERIAMESAARAAEEAKRAKHLAVLKNNEERLRLASQNWKAREIEEKKALAAKKTGGKKRKAQEEDAILSDDDEDDQPSGMSIEEMQNRNAKMKKLVEKRQKKNSNEDDLFGSESEGEGDNAPEEKSAAPAAAHNELFGSDSSDEE
ncbi:RNA polymerase-associated protein CTR9 [Thraustotheca clavata]|uniref:RNA polymerase-associated protein CTR9 n=1 Tax=Thraustotheca clavata TaxID=74557 RepID=A0A1V9ZWW7_9STRA|nr:RNA polymerase-associated protein CTR9 [Thraustotheca clavata]